MALSVPAWRLGSRLPCSSHTLHEGQLRRGQTLRPSVIHIQRKGGARRASPRAQQAADTAVDPGRIAGAEETQVRKNHRYGRNHRCGRITGAALAGTAPSGVFRQACWADTASSCQYSTPSQQASTTTWYWEDKRHHRNLCAAARGCLCSSARGCLCVAARGRLSATLDTSFNCDATGIPIARNSCSFSLAL